MPRRVSMLFALVVFAATVASASDEACTRDTLPRARAWRTGNPACLDGQDCPSSTEVPYGTMDVLVARIGPDGKVIIACVDSEAAAKRFLEAPIEKVAKKAQEK